GDFHIVCAFQTQRITGDGHGWVDMGDSPVFGTDSSNYITVAPVRDGPAGNFRHAVSVNILKKRIVPLTHGKYEVTRILTWDHSNDVIYFLGIPEGKPGQLHIYRVTSVPPRTGASLPPPVCLTCIKEPAPTTPPFISLDENIYRLKSSSWDEEDDDTLITTPPPRRKKKQKQKSTQKEPPCLYHNAIFSPNSAYYVMECLGPGIPTASLYKTAMPKPRLLVWLQNNTRLRERVDNMALPQIKTFPVQISGDIRRRFDSICLRDSERTRSLERWRIDWNTYLAGHKDFIIAQIDGRGSGGQGHQLLHKVYYKLGSVEVSDQLEVTEYLRDTQHFIDKRRVAVWGWSYGGFVAALALASPKSVFQCAIAVAPVTNWRLYVYDMQAIFKFPDKIRRTLRGTWVSRTSRITTRVTRRRTSAKKAHQLKDKMFYLVHGSADDNVHLQQSMALVKSLTEAETLFRQQIYPDESHSLSGVKKHLYKSMDEFFDDCFRKQVPPEFKAGLRDDVE
ncbi:hypothetical protein NQ318_012986, partial [Aromia moschata]